MGTQREGSDYGATIRQQSLKEDHRPGRCQADERFAILGGYQPQALILRLSRRMKRIPEFLLYW